MMPFVMRFGMRLYFALSFEPAISYPIIITILFAAITLTYWNKFFILSLCAIFGFGFFYAATFTRIVDTPKISRVMRDVEITGTITNIDYTTTKTRLFIKTPRVVRVSVDDTIRIPKIGDTVRANATLYPPSAPDAPNTFDYARWSYFNGISATGYLSELDVIETGKTSLNSFRDDMHHGVNSFLADTLVLGYKNVVPDNDNAIWTAVGINHVWSISGFHMTLVGGWLFAFFYLQMYGTAVRFK